VGEGSKVSDKKPLGREWMLQVHKEICQKRREEGSEAPGWTKSITQWFSTFLVSRHTSTIKKIRRHTIEIKLY